MTILLTYAYNSNPEDQKIYGLIVKDEHDKEVWLASTIEANNFQKWQSLASLGSKIGSGSIWKYRTLIMQIRNDTIYILDRNDALLFVISLDQLSQPVKPILLPPEVNDYLQLYQINSLYIGPNKIGVSLYLGVDNKVLRSDDEGKTWTTYWASDDKDLTVSQIKVSNDLMVLVPVGVYGSIFVAPLGSPNFQKYTVGTHLNIDGVFFNNYIGKVLILMDTTGYIRTFNYTITNNDEVIITPLYTLQSNDFETGYEYSGNQADATHIGGKVSIGFINNANNDSYVYASAEVSNNAKITKEKFVIFDHAQGTAPDVFYTLLKFTMDTHGPLLYSENGILYVSVDLGDTWQSYNITLSQ